VADVVRLAGQARLSVERVSKSDLARLTGSRRHQGVALETSSYPYAQVREMLAAAESAGEPPLLLILDLLQDPQNVGSLLRTAEAVGVHGVLLQKRRAVGVTPSVVKASSGATEHLLISLETNLTGAMRQLKEAGVWLYGLEGRPGATPLQRTDLRGPVGLVLGSEGAGLRRLIRDTCDFLVLIPMRGKVESLNVAAAGSVALYAVWQRRGYGGWGTS
jgi:23S rRNA (guanosine2251-2'-O)-methyltransferase